MRLRKRWLVSTTLVAAALAWRQYRRGGLERLVENLRRYSAPTATIYDAVTAPLLRRFFRRVAGDLAELAPEGRILEVGAGPGRLAATLAKLAPGVRVTGVDIAPDMVQRASKLAARSGVADRVAFGVGDVAALPFGEASFEVVVSTLSAHHWPDPARGLAEIHRVLRPGGVVWIYDLADWITRLERHGPGIAEVAADSPFGGGDSSTQRITLRVGPVPLIYRTELQRGSSTAPAGYS
jgi:SAM-dependent methyltransferase